MIHNLPETPAFRDERPDSPISEIALRVLVEFEGGETHVIGTASLIAGHLAITAKHVLEHPLREFGVQKKTTISQEVRDYAVRLYQVMPGPVYRIWQVCTAWYCETDIAILHLGLSGTSEPDRKVEWRIPPIRATPPPVGQKIIAFGYRESVVKVSPNEAGGYHLDLQDKPSTSFGEVKRIYPEGRDSVMLPFPCYEVNARLDPGMSGGLVIDESGALCGLICASMPAGGPRQEAVSHITTLWPMFRTLISANRAGNYPKGVSYPMIDLALDGLIRVVDLAALDLNYFPGRILPQPRR
jgi:Trypsin-like peptidase domain